MFASVRSAIKPPYGFKDLYVIFVILFVLLLIPIMLRSSAQNLSKNPVTLALGNATENFSVQFTSPSSGQTLSSTVRFDLTAAANEPVARLQTLIDGQLFNLTTNPIRKNSFDASFNLDTTVFKNGSHKITAVAMAESGKSKTTSLNVTFENPVDTAGPAISFNNPQNGAKISGTVNIAVSAADSGEVTQLSLFIDGDLALSTTQSSLNYLWNSDQTSAGDHTLLVQATDNSGNMSKETIQIYHSAASLVH